MRNPEWEIHFESASRFADLISEGAGVDFNVCYQCRKCVAGCPVVEFMDYTPVQLLHAVRLGLREPVLGCSTIWLRASCETRLARCPQEVDLVHMMDSLRYERRL